MTTDTLAYFQNLHDKNKPCFCEACLVDKLESEMSGRFCLGCVDVATETVKKEPPIYYSEGGQVCFVDGCAWGLTPTLQTVYLGTEKDVLATLSEQASEATKSTTEAIGG